MFYVEGRSDVPETTGQFVALLNIRDSPCDIQDALRDVSTAGQALADELAKAIELVESATDRLYDRWQDERMQE